MDTNDLCFEFDWKTLFFHKGFSLDVANEAI